jgi:hypothetical protein
MALACALLSAIVLTAPAASAAPSSRVARPAVKAFTVKPRSLSGTGGKLTLTAVVARGRTCTFTSTPAVHGLPAKVRCSAGRAVRVVTLPASSASAERSYRFGLSVSGPGGTVKAKAVVTTEGPALPTVTGFIAAPDGLTKAGGTTTLTAKVTHAETCRLSSVPAVAGLPVTTACAAGSAAASFGEAVSLSALTSSSAVSYTFTLTVTGTGGSAKALASQTVWPAMTFAPPQAIDPPAGGLDAVSCATSTFCEAVDRFGNAFSFRGKTWSGPSRIDAIPDGLVTGMTTAISCPATTFCAEVDQNGNAATYNGSRWSAPTTTGISAAAVSCPSSTFCAAVGSSYTSVYSSTGGAWSPTVLTTNTSLVAVSCPSSSFCLAVNSGGDSFTYNGSSWSTATAFDTANSNVTGVSCLSATSCVAVDGDGYAAAYNGSTWSTPAKIVVGSDMSGLDAVSCAPAAAYCLASASDGDAYIYNGATWAISPEGALAGFGPLGAVSCPSGSFCAVIGYVGDILTLSGTTTNDQSVLQYDQGFTTSVSCPSTTFCAAADWTGSVVTYNGVKWNPPQAVDPGYIFTDISCTSSTFCIALENPGSDNTTRYMMLKGTSWTFGEFSYNVSSVSCTGPTFCVALASIVDTVDGASVYALTWNGSVWSAPQLIDSSQGVSPPPGTGYVSCASRDFCAVADTGGNVLTFNGASWSAPDTIDAGVVQPLDAISCPTSEFCMAVDGFGQAFAYNGATWSATGGLSDSNGITDVSCASAQFCVGTDGAGGLVTYYSGTWSLPTMADPGRTSPYGFTGVSCPTVDYCAAVDFEGNVVTGTG